jgi:hypothetical protein
MSVATTTWTHAGAAPAFDFGGASATTGTSAVYARSANPAPYEGTQYGEYQVWTGDGLSGPFARSQATLNGTGTLAGPKRTVAGDETFWLGTAIYLPVGTLAAMTSQLDFLRGDNFDQHSGSGAVGTGTQRPVQVGIHQSDKKLFVQSLINGSTTIEHLSGITVTEGVWHHVEVKCTLHDTTGLIELWFDGVLMGSSTQKTIFSGGGFDANTSFIMSRVRVGVCGVDATPGPITIYCDRTSLRSNASGRLGPVGGGTPTVGTTPPTLTRPFEGSAAAHLGWGGSLNGTRGSFASASAAPAAYEGTAYGTFTIPAGPAVTGTQELFTRVQESFASPNVARAGDSIYSGVGIYLPAGFLAAMQGDVCFGRGENYDQNAVTTEYCAQLVIRDSDSKVALQCRVLGSTATTLVVSNSAITEGAWHFVEWFQTISPDGSVAVNQLWLNNVEQGV